MGSLLGVVARKGTNAPSMVLSTLLGQESKGSVAGSFELAMRPVIKVLVTGVGGKQEHKPLLRKKKSPWQSSCRQRINELRNQRIGCKAGSNGSKTTYMLGLFG